jgi:peptide/nickel transport system permease protein
VSAAQQPVAVPTSAWKLAWARRRRALRVHWSSYRRNRQGMVGLWTLSASVALAIVSPLLVDAASIDPSTAPGIPFTSPSLEFPLGTDNFGRSVLDLVLQGARISLMVGFAATLGAMLIGALVGVVAGYFGGTKIDAVLNVLTNWFLVIPWLVLAIALATILGPTLLNVILVIAVTSWATTARLVRAQALSVRERAYVERSRALGGGHGHVIVNHILPNVFPVLFANTVLTVALSILSETTLSLLGLGDPTAVSWGRIIEEAFSAGALTAGYWWWLIPPGVTIVIVTLSFTMCGYALDEILNPKLRER